MAEQVPTPAAQPAPAAAEPAPAGPQSEGAQGAQAAKSPQQDAAADQGGVESDGAQARSQAATARHGQGTLRGEAMRHADRFLVEGDYVGQKNIYLLGGTRGGRLRRVSGFQVEAARHAFVDPPGWGEVRAEAFAGGVRTAVIRAAPGQGRMAAAIRLLLPTEQPVFLLQSDTDIHLLGESLEGAVRPGAAEPDGPAPGCGFILWEPAALARLDTADLAGLDETLERLGSRLVIVTSAHGPTPSPVLSVRLAQFDQGPALRKLVLSHMRWQLRSEATVAQLTADGTETTEFIDRQLKYITSCEHGAWLAGVIVEQHLSGESFDAQRMAEQFARRDAREFDIWFAGLRDGESRCLAIALAALNGLEYERIARAGRRLHERLGRPREPRSGTEAESAAEGVGPFRRTREQLLPRLRARIQERDAVGLLGTDVTAQTLSYRDPAYAGQVLVQTWAQYQIHDALLAWLAELAEDTAEPVRVAAGSALGLLACVSFDFVCRNTLIPWAEEAHAWRRDAVAYALRVVASDAALLPSVKALTRSWYADKGRPLVQSCAVRALGLALAEPDPVSVVDELERLLTSEAVETVVALGDSLADLLEAYGSDLAVRILAGLARAVEDPRRAAAARLCFLILVDGLLSPGDTGERGNVRWPRLLWEFYRAPSQAGVDLARLWNDVLTAPVLRREAQTLLARWAGQAEHDDVMRDTLLLLLRAVGRVGGDALDLVERAVLDWDDEESLTPLPVVATAVRDLIAIERKGEQA